ncbi:MAG: AbrB/MazE/SpoVT family DNA-binding domain-containing protein [bacterium]|nr:AbrB/MazE/SpoVT family DNA-binding domain-containing protein [bacterium]
MLTTISKITRAGQITLPKIIRDSKAFVGARAVLFEERGDEEVVIRPLRAKSARGDKNDHLSIVEHTMRDWLDEVNDDLFNVSIV